MPRRQRLGLKNIREGGKYIAASLIVEGLLLAPKTTVTLGGKNYQVGGIIPMLQKEIATAVRDTVNFVFPKAAGSLDAVLRRFSIKEKLTDRILWFVYDYMEQFSISTVLGFVMERTPLGSNNNVTGLRDHLDEVLANKQDRDKLLRGLTESIMNAIGIIADGTVLSALFTERVTESLTELITTLLDRALMTETGNSVVDRFLDAIDHYENLTLAGFLEQHLGMNRLAVEEYLDRFYEKNVGADMVDSYSNLTLGDELYAKIAGMNYDAVFKDITENHRKDLVGVTVSAAGTALTIMNYANKMNARDEKKAAKKTAKVEKKKAGKADKARRKVEKTAKKAGVRISIDEGENG